MTTHLTLPSQSHESTQERLARLQDQRWHAIRVASRYMRDRHDVLDAVHEAFLKIAVMDEIDWDRIEGLVTTVTRNACIDQIRATARRHQRDEVFLRSLDVGADYVEDICDRAEAEWLASNLSKVGEREQRILHRVADGAQIKQIAQEEGITDKAAYCALSRARKVLTSVWLSSLSIWALVRARSAKDKGVMLASLVSLGTAATFAVGTPVGGGGANGPINDDAEVLPVDDPLPSIDSVGNRQMPKSNQEPAKPRPVATILPRLGRGGMTRLGDPAVIRSEDPDSKLGDSLSSCLKAGVVVSLARIGCGETNRK